MKKILLPVFVLLFISTQAQNVFISEAGEVTFYSYAIVEDIKATSKQVNSIINSVNGEFAFMIPMRSFHFEKALMEEHFNEKYIESEKFPQATFKGTIVEKFDATKNGKVQLTAKGKMNIHGVEKEITEPGELEIENNKMTFTTHFYIAIADYNIKKPQLLFNNIADTIEIKMKATYVPYKKK